ncbi:MAG: hypothetical protein JJT75_01740 [Opitutales bacterium]|nr:hypothetical protein [Opitutales bacterium]MCH8541717.1 hypothetical protein [Opitutales bacterium]
MSKEITKKALADPESLKTFYPIHNSKDNLEQEILKKLKVDLEEIQWSQTPAPGTSPEEKYRSGFGRKEAA